MDWPTVRLEQVTSKIGSGATPRGGKESYKTEGVALFRSLNVYDLRFDESGLAFIDDEQAGKLDNVTVLQGDVLLNITGASVARCALSPSSLLPARVNQHVAILRPRPLALDSHFLAYSLVSPRHKGRLLAIAQGGATREALTKRTLEDFDIPVPALRIQRKIAAVLGAYDELIENNLRRIEILEEMAQAVYREWFVNFGFHGHEDVDLVDSPLGPIPDGWSVATLGDVADVSWGDTRVTKKSYSVEGFVAYSAAGPDGLLSYFDYDRTGVVLSAIGARCGRTWFTWGKWSCIKNTIRFWSVDERVPDTYLYLATNDPNRWPKRGAAQPFISQSDARAVLVIVPDAATAQRLASFAEPVFRLRDSLTRQNTNLRSTRDLLLPKLVSGEVDVSDLDIDVDWLVA